MTGGGCDSSGIRKYLRRRSLRPRPTRLVNTDSGIDSMSAPTTGSSHHRYDGFSHQTIAAHSTPTSVCRPWRRNAYRHPVSLSPRGGDFQRTACPASAIATNCVWNSMRIGASNADSSISPARLTARRSYPPCGAGSVQAIRSAARIFGRNSSTAVAEKSAIAHSGRHCGHSGNS